MLRPIRTKRLVIRDWKADDWRAIQRYAGDPEVCRHMIWGPNTPAQTRAFLKLKIAEQKARPRSSYEMGIALRSTGAIIGAVGMRLLRPRVRTADVGYVLAREHWGHGYMTEAVKGILRFGFGRLRLHRMFATCDQRNRRSARVLERSGMRREAAFKRDDLVKGRWRDSFLYAILKTEFN